MSKKKSIKKILTSLVIIAFIVTLLPTKITFAAAAATPGVPTLASNQWGTDVDGNYDISINLWYGNNGTSYKLFERLGISGEYKVVSEGALMDNSPGSQSFVVPIRNRTATGSYNYYAQLNNSYGTSTSPVFGVKVGKDGDTKILIDGVDDIGVKLQHTIAKGIKDYKLSNAKNANSDFTVNSSNTSSVKASIVNGNILRLEGLAAGRSGIKVVDRATGDIRQIGIRVKKADGTLPGMPEYLSVGQVSEDTDNDLNFWKDTNSDDRNKRTDIRYIYINGGYEKGWRTWTTEDGARAKGYIAESLKLGMIPFFVYYNIPDNDESYDVDFKHINDKTYMEGYFKDLKFLLDICTQYGGDETIGLVLEPDFLGYMMQKSGKQPEQIKALVDAAYSSGVLDKTKDPAFGNNVNGLVQAINYTVRKYYKTAYFGWQFNIWAYDGPEIPGQGILHKTELIGWDAGRKIIKQVATETANYYMAAGITSNGADFISIDKYGLDGGYENGAKDNPSSSRWLWNSDIWNNYLLYTKTLNEQTKKPVILWQLPVGRINSSLEPNPYNGGRFPDLTGEVANYEDSAPTYFFGDSFKPGSGNRLNYFSKSEAKDAKIKVSGDTVTWGSHMEEAKASGIISILFGAGVGASTDAVGSPAPDNYWWITKAQRYLKNPLKLDGSETIPMDLPLVAKISVDNATNTGTYKLAVDIPASSKATSYKVYENGIEMKNGQVATAAQSLSVPVINKPTGTYMYTVDLINANGSTSSSNLTVTVNNNTVPPITHPLKGILTVDKVSNDGSYNISVGIPAKSNATSYNLYENNEIIKTGVVTDLAQSFVQPFTGVATGTYEYKMSLINKDATTASDILKVAVTSAAVTPHLPVSGLKVDFSVISDWGSGSSIKVTLTNNTNADISNWQVMFDFDKQITAVYDGDLTVSGKTCTLKSKAWNGAIGKGKTLVLTGASQGNIGALKPYNLKVICK
ncbi:cellulose binding domain-containing protein [Clostridium sp. FP2]|uniref:cellulose binding domain-containing protein n=1 Tax=Clostridium sp. FP2 TaxID=2724481 RepID=UPI0013E948E3|nr:cellulose binding domain-containing protein [Clostridium sp. FP2]MBZ9625570.1 cellulose binding domain-containing protein [Clostridium sp. FP2]